MTKIPLMAIAEIRAPWRDQRDPGSADCGPRDLPRAGLGADHRPVWLASEVEEWIRQYRAKDIAEPAEGDEQPPA